MNENHNLPINVDSGREVGSITYANEVIAIIAGMAMYEIEGVVGMPSASAGIADIFTRPSKPMTKGVKVEVGTEETSVDLMFTVEYGKPIQKVCTDVQENVRKAIESMTGLHVVKVDVHVTGISFEKETKAIEQSYASATADVDELDIDTDIEDDGEYADVDSPPAGVDPDTLPVRNIHMNDDRTEDENEEASAGMRTESETDDEGA